MRVKFSGKSHLHSTFGWIPAAFQAFRPDISHVLQEHLINTRL
jgi:hypothetical protein